MMVIRLALVAAFVALAGAILWAAGTASFAASFGAMIADPWGVVTLIDLYAGFLAAAVLIVALEPRRPVAIAASALLPFLGNLVLLAWLIWRGLSLLRRNTNV